MNKISSRLERNHFIYKWTNLVNNKIYIGMTCNPTHRAYQYKSATKRGSQDLIHRAMRKYGFENFKFELIAFFDNFDGADMAEPFYIALYNSRDMEYGYNLSPGGCAFVDAEIGKKIKAGLKRFYDNNVSKMKGFKHTQESRDKLSKSSMGKPGTNKGRKFSEEWKKKISIANTGKKHTEETKKKLSEFNHRKGIPACNRKLTIEQVREIRKKYSEGAFINQLARDYNISYPTMSSIVKGYTYKEKESNE